MLLFLVLFADLVFIIVYITNIRCFKYQPLFMVFMGTSFLFYMVGTTYVFFEKWYSFTFNRTLYLTSLFHLDVTTCTKAHYIYFSFLIGVYFGFLNYERTHKNFTIRNKRVVNLLKGEISPNFILICSLIVGLLHYYGIFSAVPFSTFWSTKLYNNYAYGVNARYQYAFSSFLLGLRTIWITFIILLFIASHFPVSLKGQYHRKFLLYRFASYVQIAAVIFVCFFMGNRRDLLFLLVGIVLTLVYSKGGELSTANIVKGIIGLILVSIIMSEIYSSRNLKMSERVDLLKDDQISIETQVNSIAGSSEFIAPYSSLPNILKYYHGEFLLGKSFYWLIISFVPRYFYPDRRGNYLYDYYESNVLSKTNAHHHVGYAINIPADLYLNFGVIGVLLFAPLLGMVLGYFEKAFSISKGNPKYFVYSSFYFSLASYSISLSRVNIEGIREFIYGSFLPLALLVFLYLNRNLNRSIKNKNLPYYHQGNGN
jgi:oligosaccharide repeat unit polymerase